MTNIFKKNISLLVIVFCIFFFSKGTAATIYFNQVYKATGTTYNVNTQSITGLQLVSGYSFKVVSAVPTATTFNSGNNENVVLYYVNSSGVQISIYGTISRQDKSGNTTIGLNFLVSNSTYTTYTGEAYLLVIPGKESNYSNGGSASTSSDPIDAVLNSLVSYQATQPVINSSVSSVTVLENAGYAVFTFSLSNAPTSNYSFTPYLTGVTAVSGTDYTNSIQYYNGTTWQTVTGSLTITSSALSFQLRVPIINYNTSVTDKTFNINTGAISGGGILNNYGTYGVGTILVPVISTSGTLTSFSSCSGVASSQQSFTVSGVNLIDNLIVTPPSGYEVSTTSGSGFVTSVSLVPVSNAVSNTTIYVRLTASALNNASGNIVCSSTSAVSVNVATNTATVTASSVAGTISSNNSNVCSGTNSTLFTLTGYTGSIQWQQSLNGSSWSNVSGATSATYTATNLTATTYFKAIVTNGSCTSATTSVSTLTVDALVTAGSISGAGTVCSSITNSKVLTLNGSAGSIQWQSSSTLTGTYTNISGATSATYTATNLSANTYFRAVVSNGSCPSATTSSVLITVLSSNVWTGTVSTAWNNAANWSCGVPASGENIEVPGGLTNYPILDGPRTIGSVLLASGATINLNNSTLSISGAITGTGTLIGSTTSSLTINGSGNQGTFYMNQTTPGTTNTVGNFTLNSTSSGSATLGNAMGISGTLTLTNGTFNTGGNLTLMSNGTTTAVVAPITDCSAVAINGDVTVERYFPARRAFRFISSPVTTTTTIRDNLQEGVNNPPPAYTTNLNPHPGYGTHITGNITADYGFDVTQTTNNSMFTFNNTTGVWAAVPNTNVLTLTAGVPYRLMIRGDRSISMSTNAPTPTNTTLRAKGALKICDASVGTISPAANGYNFIGNPYQATVDIKQVLTQNAHFNTNYYWVWDPKINTRGGYVAYDLSTGINPVNGSQVNQYLQPWQGCFVKNDATAGGTITFHESNKSTSVVNENVYKATTTVPAYIRATLYESNTLATTGVAADGLVVKFDSSYDNLVDSNDANKLTNQDEIFATKNNTSLLGIESRIFPVETDVIPLNITQYRNTNYTIVAQGNNMSGIPAYLHDQLLQTYTEIPQSDSVSYSYSISSTDTATSAPDRFRIVFQNPNLSTNTNSNLIFTLYPNPSKQGVFDVVVNNATQDTKLTIYNSIGQTVYSTYLTDSPINHINPNSVFATGVYYVKIAKEGTTTIKKLIIE